MEILSDTRLRRLLKRGLEIEPAPKDEAFQPASIDLRLGKVYRQRTDKQVVIGMDEDFDENDFLEEIDFDSELDLEPGKFLVLETEESVKLPENHLARVFQRSRYGRSVLEAFAFGFVDGNSPLLNPSKQREKIRYSINPRSLIKVKRGQRACQLAVFGMEGRMYTAQRAVDERLLEVAGESFFCSCCGNMVLHAGEIYLPNLDLFLIHLAKITVMGLKK